MPRAGLIAHAAALAAVWAVCAPVVTATAPAAAEMQGTRVSGPTVKAAAAHSKPLRVDEINGVSCARPGSPTPSARRCGR